MNNLPKNFPEYSIMYKTLSKRIRELEGKAMSPQTRQSTNVQEDIEKYKAERQRIKDMFPDGFFEENENKGEI